MKPLSYLSLFALLFFCSYKPGMCQKVKDYLHVPGPIEFKGLKYGLAWSSHPSSNYYKQEYVPAGQQVEKFTKMIMLEALTGETEPLALVRAKTTELNNRKSSDPVTNYRVIENKSMGEYLLDFVISAPGADGKLIVEWNAYRYRQVKDKSGKKAVVLFAYGRRAYGGDTTDFLEALKDERQADINAIAAYRIPEVSF